MAHHQCYTVALTLPHRSVDEESQRNKDDHNYGWQEPNPQSFLKFTRLTDGNKCDGAENQHHNAFEVPDESRGVGILSQCVFVGKRGGIIKNVRIFVQDRKPDEDNGSHNWRRNDIQLPTKSIRLS